MWPFSKKYSIVSSGLLRGATDWHCHILPGVDDGIQTIEDSLAVLDRYAELGIREVWLTPHVMEDIPNTPDELRATYDELLKAYQGQITLHLASENMLDAIFEERLVKGHVLPIGTKGDHLLVETSYFNPPMDLYGMLKKIRERGFKPILAHPERYNYMSRTDYQRLKSMDILFQINITSVAEAYGREVRQKAEMLLSEHWIDYIGTDVHRLSSLNKAIENRIIDRDTCQMLSQV